MNDNFEDALSKIKLIAGGLCGGNYEPRSARDIELADQLLNLHDRMQKSIVQFIVVIQCKLFLVLILAQKVL